MPAPARVASIIKRCLGEVGISVDVILSEPADHQRALWAGEHDLALHGWFNDNGDPDNFLYTLLDSDNTTGTRPSNIAFYSNAWFHDVIGMAQRTTDPKDPTARTERERLYSQAQAILAIDVPWVPLAHSKVVFAQRGDAARAGRAAVGDGPLPLGGARAMSPDGKGGPTGSGQRPTGRAAPKGRAARSSGADGRARQQLRRLRSSSGNLRQSQHLPRRRVAGTRRQRLVAAGERGDAAARLAAAAVRRPRSSRPSARSSPCRSSPSR